MRQVILGAAITVDAHDVDVTYNGATVNVVIAAQTYLSPLLYLEAILAGAGATSWTVTPHNHTTYTLEDIDGFATGGIEWDVGDPAEASYLGADPVSHKVVIGTVSEALDYQWSGGIKREPGLLTGQQVAIHSTRNGYWQQPGRIANDTLSVWVSEAAWSELDAWYVWLQVALAQTQAIDVYIEDEDTHTSWFLDPVDYMPESVEGEGLYVFCEVPLVRVV